MYLFVLFLILIGELISSDNKYLLYLFDFVVFKMKFVNMQLVVNLLKILCTNTAWQRRKLGKVLQDWSVISIQVYEYKFH